MKNPVLHLQACARYRTKNRRRNAAELPSMLTCYKCKVTKPVAAFARDTGDKRGFRHDCKACQSQSSKARYAQHRQQILEGKRQFRQRYPDKVRECKRVSKMRRRRVDPIYRLENGLRTRVWNALRGFVKSAATLRMLGCSVEFLQQHLQARFKPGMTWDNYGSYWQVDHKIPCAKFNLANPMEQRQCFHWTNLQPLTADENRRKGAFV